MIQFFLITVTIVSIGFCGAGYILIKILRMNRTNMSMLTVGSKRQVFFGTAKHTSGGLKKKDLMKHKGRIISRKKHAAGKKAIKHLFALGYKPTKGKFTAMRKSMAKPKSSRRHSRKRGGGCGMSQGFESS